MDRQSSGTGSKSQFFGTYCGVFVVRSLKSRRSVPGGDHTARTYTDARRLVCIINHYDHQYITPASLYTIATRGYKHMV